MNRSTNRSPLLIAFLAALVVMAWMTFLLEARIGGGQKYASKRTGKSSRSNYTAPSSTPSTPDDTSNPASSRSVSSGKSPRSSYDGTGSVDFSGVHLGVLLIIVGVILIVGFLLVAIYNYYNDLKYSSLEEIPPGPKPIVLPGPLDSRERDRRVARLQEEDPNFSLPLFLDLAQLLYTDTLINAGKGQLEKLGLFLLPKVSRWLGTRFAESSQITDVIIGAMDVINIESDPGSSGVNTITLGFESNYTVESKTAAGSGDRPQIQAVYEYSAWSFSRKSGVVSKGPGKLNTLSCVRCSAPLSDGSGGVCSYCGANFLAGEDTWAVNRIKIYNHSTTAPSVSHQYAKEMGTDRPTRFHHDLMNQIIGFKERYPEFDMTRFTGRVTFIFILLQKAWSDMKWELARPYETDALFQSHLYWINQFSKENVRNVLDRIRVTRVEPVKIQQDAYYDAITLRIHASMLDYIATQKGWLVAGNHKWPRRFTEYWTFIRRAGAGERDDDEFSNCPSCGDALKVGMMGKCSACGTKITGGEFDWVLSMIEQDETYTG